MFVFKSVHICVNSFRRYYTLFGAYPNYTHIKILGKITKGLMLGLAELMPDCWLVVSLYPEGPANGQLDQRFPWFSLGPRAITELVPQLSEFCILGYNAFVIEAPYFSENSVDFQCPLN
jgi:hypothetical protein